VIGNAARGRIAGLLAGIGVVASATFAHVRAGAQIAPAVVLPVVLLVVGGASAVGPKVRWTFARLVVASIAAQLALHLAYGIGTSHPTASHHHEHGGAMHAASGVSADMWILHLGLAIVVAVAARWGARWLRAMPGLVGALLVPARTVVPVSSRHEPASAPETRWAGRDADVAWDSRGPPAVA
jgi:hypothetical protein